MDQAQNLVKTAVDATIKEIAKGKAPTEALTKVSQELGLNSNFIQRAGEAINVALTFSHFKTASDKSTDFPIVDIPAVTKNSMTSKEKTLAEKKASWFPVVNDNPDFVRNIFDPSFTKVAATKLSRTEEDEILPTFEHLAQKLANEVSRLDKEYDQVLTKKVGNELFLEASFNNLVNYFKKEAGSRESFDEFETAVYAMHGTAVSPYIDLIHTTCKTAEDRGIHDQFKFAAESVDLPSAKYFFDFASSIGQQKELTHKVAYTKAILELTKAGIASAYNGLISSEEVKEAGEFADDLEELFSKQAGVVTKSIAEKLLEDYKNATKTKQSPVFQNSSMDNRNRSLMLQELVMIDPILAHQDPRKITEAYQQILRLAPHIAKEKEVVRSLLRQMVATQSLAPVEANQLIETNTNLLRQHKLLKETSGQSGGEKK